jgi:hypothetical protein
MFLFFFSYPLTSLNYTTGDSMIFLEYVIKHGNQTCNSYTQMSHHLHGWNPDESTVTFHASEEKDILWKIQEAHFKAVQPHPLARIFSTKQAIKVPSQFLGTHPEVGWTIMWTKEQSQKPSRPTWGFFFLIFELWKVLALQENPFSTAYDTLFLPQFHFWFRILFQAWMK